MEEYICVQPRIIPHFAMLLQCPNRMQLRRRNRWREMCGWMHWIWYAATFTQKLYDGRLQQFRLCSQWQCPSPSLFSSATQGEVWAVCETGVYGFFGKSKSDIKSNISFGQYIAVRYFDLALQTTIENRHGLWQKRLDLFVEWLVTSLARHDTTMRWIRIFIFFIGRAWV